MTITRSVENDLLGDEIQEQQIGYVIMHDLRVHVIAHVLPDSIIIMETRHFSDNPYSDVQVLARRNKMMINSRTLRQLWNAICVPCPHDDQPINPYTQL